MNKNNELPGVVIAEDFKTTGTLTLPEGSVAIVVVANHEDSTYRAGAILRSLAADPEGDIMRFISNLGLGLLIAATDEAEDTLALAANTDMSNIAVARSDEPEFGVPTVSQTSPPDLETCDVKSLARA